MRRRIGYAPTSEDITAAMAQAATWRSVGARASVLCSPWFWCRARLRARRRGTRPLFTTCPIVGSFDGVAHFRAVENIINEHIDKMIGSSGAPALGLGTPVFVYDNYPLGRALR